MQLLRTSKPDMVVMPGGRQVENPGVAESNTDWGGRMAWPLPSHFSTMVQTPRLAFRDPALHTCQIERTAMNQPRVWSGQFAVVYKAVDAQGKPRAVRAFTSESRSRREHYDCISAHLKTCRLKCLVEFEYQDPGIRSAGDGKWYPLVVMDWVEGMTLFEWVASKCRAGKGRSIVKALQHWLRLIDELSGARIAHGDLQACERPGHASRLPETGRLRRHVRAGLGRPPQPGTRRQALPAPPAESANAAFRTA
jgi:hypothetical protein